MINKKGFYSVLPSMKMYDSQLIYKVKPHEISADSVLIIYVINFWEVTQMFMFFLVLLCGGLNNKS